MKMRIKTDEVNFTIYLCEAQILNLQYLRKVSTKVERKPRKQQFNRLNSFINDDFWTLIHTKAKRQRYCRVKLICILTLANKGILQKNIWNEMNSTSFSLRGQR